MIHAGTISGRVFDNKGRPFVGVAVEAERLDYSTDARGRLVTIESQLTNDPGEYRLISVRPGEYYVRTNVDNYRIKTPAGSDASTYFPGMSDMSKAERILVGEGAETRNIDIFSRPAQFTISGRILRPGVSDISRMSAKFFLVSPTGPVEDDERINGRT